MITVMRQYRRAVQVGLLIVIAAFVLTSVFVFGQGGMGGGADNRDAVAMVNGEAIPFDRYQRAYQNYINMYAQVSRRQLTAEMAERMGVPGQVVDALVNETLVVQRARAEGLGATDRDVNDYVAAIPSFKENGRFSVTRYRDVLRRNGLTEVNFERDVRRELTRSKMEATVRAGVKVSEPEVEQAFVLRREEVRAAWALVEVPPLIAATTASDEELQAYLKDSGAQFRHPERRKIQYVTVSPRDFTRPVTDADVEKYYTEHAAEFDVPQQARAAHILVRVGETGGSEAEDKAKAKVADVIRRAQAGEDFAKLARTASEDAGSAPKGGDLGWVKKGEMVPEFEQAVFALKKGELTPEPVRSPFGFHAIKVMEVREGGRPPLKEVAPRLRERLAGEAADGAAKAKAEEVKPPLQGAKDFMEEARRLGLTAAEATVARVERVGLATPDPLEEAAFALAVGGVSVPVKTPAGWIVLKAMESIPAGVPPLAEIKDAVTAAVKRQKAEAVALERAKQIETDAKSGDLLAAGRKAGATTGETARFSRMKPVDRLPGDVLLAAIQTPAGAVSAPVKTQQGYYVLKVLERVPPDLSELPREREKLARDLLAAKQNQAWEAWLSGTRASSKVDMTGRVSTSRRG